MRLFLIITLFICVATKNYAQLSKTEDATFNSNIQLNLSKVLSEVAVSWETPIIGRLNQEISFHYCYPNELLSSLSSPYFLGIGMNDTRFKLQGAKVGYALKLYSKKHPEHYTFWGLSFERKEAENFDKWLKGGGSGYTKEIKMDQVLQSVHLKILRGYRVNKKFVRELYYGAGFKVSHANSNYIFQHPEASSPSNYDSMDQFGYDDVYHSQGFYYAPTVHLGFKFGVSY